MDKQNGFVPILVILLIALAAAGGYLVYTNYSNNRNKIAPAQTIQPAPVSSPASSETANWKIYTNEKMKFSMKLPPQWFSHPEENNSILFSYPVDNPAQVWAPKQQAYIYINVFRNIDGMSLDQLVRNRLDLMITTNPDLIELPQTANIDGDKGVVLYSKNDFYEDVLVIHQNLIYTISLHTSNLSYQNKVVPLEEMIPVFNQILSTFKFLDQNLTDEIATWKTYTNKDYGFSFKYPAQFNLKEDKYPADQPDTKTLYNIWFITQDQKYSGYNVRIHKAPGKTILQEFPQEFRQQAPSLPVKTLLNTQGADEAASAGQNERGYQSGIRYFRVKDTFFGISPIVQDSTSSDRIWYYPILDTLTFNK